MPIVDYHSARVLLNSAFAAVEKKALQKSTPSMGSKLGKYFNVIFASSTQAYREVLLGCTIARIQNKEIDIKCPYVDQGEHAFSGRSLDEKAINPFLHDQRIPSSRGPYLSVFRRSIKFDVRTRSGVKDKDGYDAFLFLIKHLETLDEDSQLLGFLEYLLFKFVELRENAIIPISRLQRISLEQFDSLITGLLKTPSGGRFPVFLIVAAFSTIKQYFNLDWDIQFQGINVADTASGAGGDITIKKDNNILLAAEVTERAIDKARVVATFNTKISPAGIEDYLFFVKLSGVKSDARQQARQYFSQGHEVNFLEMKDWIISLLATMGKSGRNIFNSTLLGFIEMSDMPGSLKVKWNELIATLVDISNQ